MARRRVPVLVAETAADVTGEGMPSWLWRFVVTDWPAKNAADAEAEAAMAREWGSAEWVAEICASTRRSKAKRAWATEHGMTLRDLGTLVRESHPEASPYPVKGARL